MLAPSGRDASARTAPPARVWPFAAALVGMTLAAYHNSLHGEFVLDDFSSVLENPSIRRLWPIGPLLSPPAEAGVGGRPLANVTFALNYALGGTAPWSYRTLNVLLHAAATLTLFGLARHTLLQPPLRARFGAAAAPLAFAVAVIWAVHPLATAAVDYVSQRTELLMALCYVVTLYAFVRGAPARCAGWLTLAVAAAAAGMASKEVMVTAPLLVLLYDRSFVAGSFAGAWRQRRVFYVALAATWAVLAGVMMNAPAMDRGIGFGLGVTSLDYALTQTHALWRYLSLSAWPAALVFDHGWTFVMASPAAAVALGGTLTLFATALMALRRWPAAGFAGAWFLVILAPTTTFVPIIQQPIAESRAYLPLAGAVALGVIAVYQLLRTRPRLLLALGVLVPTALAAITVRRHDAYRTEIALWTDTVAKRPGNARAHGNLAAAFLRAQRPHESLAAADAAIRLRPAYAEAHHNRGVALARLGEPAAALAAYRSALAANPRFADAHYNLGEFLASTGRATEARRHFEIAHQLRPRHAATLNNLSVVVLQLGDAPVAAAHARSALRLEPRLSAAHYNLGNALNASGRIPEAIAAYEAALRHEPRFARAEHNLGVLKLKTGRTGEAIAHFETALRLEPDYAEARRHLAIARQAP